jgi:hypothetical protein
MTQPKQLAYLRRCGLVAVALIALVSCFAAANIAAANAAPTPGRPLGPALDEPRTEEIWEEEGWDEGNSEEGEAEEPEEESEESEESESTVPAECNLYATTAHLVASDRHDSVRLTLRYETGEATNVKVEYWLKGGHGSLQLSPLRRHMSTRGTIQGSERLSAREMAKVRAARVFVVHLDMPGLPQYCERYCTRRLTVKREAAGQTTWSEPPLGTERIR